MCTILQVLYVYKYISMGCYVHRTVPNQPMMIGPRMRMRIPNQPATKVSDIVCVCVHAYMPCVCMRVCVGACNISGRNNDQKLVSHF